MFNLVCFREEIPKSGTTISDLIMNSSITLTPMFNLSKARRESSQRKEKYESNSQNFVIGRTAQTNYVAVFEKHYLSQMLIDFVQITK